MPTANVLGEYLRARRELVQPDDVGLSIQGTRRVPGLRREEVALLAGISADYYLRLEQGRDRKPSLSVIEALARVLQLDATATAYLLSIATPQPAQRRTTRRETVALGIRQMLDVIGLPAFVEGRYFDVLAANSLATALNPLLRVGQNRIRSMFLDPIERELYPDWERLAPRMVAGMRRRIGADTDDPRFTQLVGELSLGSERFSRLWARHDVYAPEGGITTLHHTEFGELTLRLEKLNILESNGQILAVYHAEPGSPSAERLNLLASWTVSPLARAANDSSQISDESQAEDGRSAR